MLPLKLIEQKLKNISLAFLSQLYWAYWILLVLHAPDFWKWIVGPAAIFLLEMFYRQVMQLIGVGKTTISQARLSTDSDFL